MKARRVAGVVLAGGRSRRMGSDKAFVSVGGRPLIAHALGRLGPQVELIAVNSNAAPALFEPYSVPVLPDTVPDYAGPLAGILAGLEWAAGAGADWLATVPVDAPLFPADLVARLVSASDGKVAVARSNGELHPVFGLFPVSLADGLARFLKEKSTRRVRDWLATLAPVTTEFPPPAEGDPDPFFNLNTPDDLARAGRFLASQKLPPA